MTSVRDRALGAMYGLAVGDALGMPTQSFSRAQIRNRYGARVDRMYAGPPDQPIAPGRAAGSVTDDTEQALLVADLLIDGDGSIGSVALAEALVAWQADMVARGSADLLGPSTNRAIEAVRAGVPPDEAGRTGTTNGAAMRVTPVGIAYAGDALIAAVADSARVTHNTSLGIAGAAAVAAAVSAGVSGAPLAVALEAGADAADEAEPLGHWVAGAPVASRIRWALDLASTSRDVVEDVERLVGTSVAAQESVPAAFAFARCGDPTDALCCAASVGGDTDTIGAMAGAMLGAVVGLSGLPGEYVDAVRTANDLRIEERVDRLLEIRERG
ncbi:ADP-ribosylglycohydrolase family protein [Solicola gregarius]|uniref:ADP-ribosylglycohydrolase family protein n=1 Tax=Solicola gregarius TaxID=2908642 RepID=A0AA46TFS7_9ACTN|nr:ADP-ribosylglycohydrolase family protein [Solicola gregarius]UYM04420.1 ADP-ribosylglycohydrolase family protein [Solicola gregarius]